jgi:DNA mismatch repair protein MutS
MSFSIDRQTIEELNLLGKFRAGSVYHLFNQVKTRGGEQLLDAMFHSPLTDVAAINARSATFAYFQTLDVSFPFDAGQVASMQEFLDMKSGSGLARIALNLSSLKLLSSLTRDERYRKEIQGLQDTIVVVQQCAALMHQFQQAPARLAYGDRIAEIKLIFSMPFFTRLLQTNIYQTFPFGQLLDFIHQLKTLRHKEVETLLAFIHEVDVYIAVSRVAKSQDFTYAKALPAQESCFEVQALRHPCLSGAVGNSLHLNQQQNVLFLTGANMAGKSTWMKSIGIAVYLAHMGFPVAASSMRFSVRDGLYTSINVADNVALGYSHFYAEVVRVKQAAEAAASGQRLMLMFDELFKGTNVKDAFDGTLAVTEGFVQYEACLFVVSTHIIEVGEELKRYPNVQFGYMPTILEGSVPRYTYRMQQGITEDRQGMMIIQNEQILELLMN